MTANGLLQIAFYFLVLLLCTMPLGWYMAQVYERRPCGLDKLVGPIERIIYRFCGIDLTREMNWIRYLIAMLVFNFFGFVFVYLIQRLQMVFPFNPQNMLSTTPHLSFNIGASFVTNTNWQSYSGETTQSYFTQMSALTVQNFVSAATGMSLLMAFIRGIRANENSNLGNFWVDTVRGILYILLPLALVLALILNSQGVIQNLKPNQKIQLLQPTTVTAQIIPMGPVASQVAIKQLGTNGGGFFNVNSAHPFENPTPISNFFEMLAILLLPVALCYTFGVMIKDTKQGWSILAAMFLMFAPFLFIVVAVEQQGNPAFKTFGINQTPQANFAGGNMEGKETRIGVVNSALWTAATTSTSNGSVTSMLDSYMPLGGAVPIWMMHLDEVVFGGVGSGLYGMFLFVIISVFVAGLMVGRTPEYLGKKIEPYEMKMASVGVLIMPLIVLVLTAIAVVSPLGRSSMANPGAHGFSEVLYAFTSMANNNGSAFAGLNSNTPFYNVIGGFAVLFGRFWVAIPALAIAGSLARKKIIPRTEGTLSTSSPLFTVMLAIITILVGALSFLPVLALGPVVEQLMIWGQYGY